MKDGGSFEANPTAKTTQQPRTATGAVQRRPCAGDSFEGFENQKDGPWLLVCFLFWVLVFVSVGFGLVWFWLVLGLVLVRFGFWFWLVLGFGFG